MRNTFFGIPLVHKPTLKFRVEIFKEYAAKRKESVWTQLLTLLNRPVGFIMNMTARVIAKMACWSRDLMQGADLQVHKCISKGRSILFNHFIDMRTTVILSISCRKKCVFVRKFQQQHVLST